MTEYSIRKPGRPRGNSSKMTKETILKTASILFLTHGYENTSMDKIAEDCKVTKASVYYYFTNKATMFTEAFTNLLGRIHYQTAKLLHSPVNIQESLYEVALAYLRTPYMDFEALIHEASPTLSKEQIKAIRLAEKQIHVELEKKFQIAIDTGEIIPGNALFLANAFTAIVLIRSRETLMEGLGSPESIANEIIQLFFLGILPRTEQSK